MEIEEINHKLKHLLEINKISAPSLNSKNVLLTDTLIDKNLISPEIANTLLEEAMGIQSLDPTLIHCSERFLCHAKALIPKNIAYQYHVFPVKHEQNFVHLIMHNPFDKKTIKYFEYITGSRIKPYCCSMNRIVESLKKNYGRFSESDNSQDKDSESITIEKYISKIKKIQTSESNFEKIINHFSVIQILQYVLNQAVSQDATDIHFEPMENTYRIRIRKDGVMKTIWCFPEIVKASITGRLKLISNMNLNINNVPQDGNINYNVVNCKRIDIRSASIPTSYGEKVTLRILDKSKKKIELTDLGMNHRDFELINQSIRKPNGMVLVTGPTGSGKTTTLYAIIEALNKDNVNIMTIEDPIEYQLKGISQTQCSDKITYSSALRHFVRQDPDIIMIGEIRDKESADIALNASMTGHIVLSTLHSNDAASSFNRFKLMNITPDSLNISNFSVIAQRLVRKICPHCKEQYLPNKELLKSLGVENEDGTYFKGIGCNHCLGTGYSGRIGIFECLEVNETIFNMIVNHQSSHVIKSYAIENDGMTSLREAAVKKFKSGVTTIDEVFRVT